METEQKQPRTQGEWEFKRSNDGQTAYRISGNGYVLADVLYSPLKFTDVAVTPSEAEANATFIVLAVNNHESLLKSLEEVLDSLGVALDIDGRPIDPYTRIAIETAKAVIAKCKSQP